MTYDYREDEPMDIPTDAQIAHTLLCIAVTAIVVLSFAGYGFYKAVELFLQRVGLGG